jgi:hypothetical protein
MSKRSWRKSGSKFKTWSKRFKVQGSEVQGSGFRGSGFRGSGFRGSEVYGVNPTLV